MPADPFPKRTYSGPGDLLSDVAWTTYILPYYLKAQKEPLITKAFKERIMMAITQVNGCKRCTQIHTKLALEAGVTKNQLKAMALGDLDECPEEEYVALLYARRWAETDMKPEKKLRRRLYKEYGKEKAYQIEMYMRQIRIGNYTGNWPDWLLYNISGGKLGV